MARTALVALLALGLALSVDAWVFGLDGPWRTMQDFMPPGHPLERGIVLDHLALRELRDVGEEARTVVVLGNSRARAAFRRAQARKVDPASVHIELSHAGMELFESLSMAYSLEPYGVDVTVLVLSELDLYRPIRLKPSAGAGSWRALGDLVSHLEIETIVDTRRDLLRAAVGALLPGYRDRRVGHAVWIDPMRRFEPSIVRFESGRRSLREAGRATLIFPIPERVLTADQLAILEDRAATRLPKVPRSGLRTQIGQAGRISNGPHADLNAALLVDLVEALRGIGSDVLLVEAPVHPLVYEVYDEEAFRGRFLRLAGDLASRPGVHFVPVEESGPFDDSSFADLTHLSRHHDHAAPRMARLIASRAREILDRRAP